MKLEELIEKLDWVRCVGLSCYCRKLCTRMAWSFITVLYCRCRHTEAGLA